MQPGDLALVNYGEVPEVWHTRILLSQVSGTRWMILTPDMDRYDEQLDHLNPDYTDFQFWGPNGDIPARINQHSVYGFRALAPADLAYHMGQARVEAQALVQHMGAPLAAPAAPGAPPPPVPPPPPGVLGAAPVVAAPVAPVAAPGAVPGGAATFVWVAIENSGQR